MEGSVAHSLDGLYAPGRLTPPKSIDDWVEFCFQEARSAGWHKHPLPLNDPEQVAVKLCLLHSELSEVMEASRKSLPSEHLPGVSGVEEEMADVFIRWCDLLGALGLKIEGTVIRKCLYNRTRVDHTPEARASANGKKF